MHDNSRLIFPTCHVYPRRGVVSTPIGLLGVLDPRDSRLPH